MAEGLRVWPEHAGIVERHPDPHLTQGVNLAALGYGNRNYNAPQTYGVTLAKRWQAGAGRAA